MWGPQCEVMTSDDVGLCGLKQIWFLFTNINSYFTLTFGALFGDSNDGLCLFSSGNHMGDEGARILAKALQINSKLR